jgi:hypothetical protein
MRRHSRDPTLYHGTVRVLRGKVVSGKVIVEGEPLEDGSTVTVLIPEPDGAFSVCEADEEKLIESLGEAIRGETTPTSDVLRGLVRTS